MTHKEDAPLTVHYREGSYTFPAHMSATALGNIATGLLETLGCSFQVVWPGRSEDEKEAARIKRLRSRANKVEQWLSEQDYLRLPADSAELEQVLQRAYLTGYDAAPKPVQ